MMNKTIKTIGTIAAIGAIAVGSFFFGTAQAKSDAEIQAIMETREDALEGHVALSECIPVDDIACHYTDDNGHICVQLKDIGYQLDSEDNASYTDVLNDIDDITDEYSSHMVDMDKVMYWEANDGLQLYYEDGSGYYWE